MTPLTDNDIKSFNGNLVWPIRTDKRILQKFRRVMSKLDELYPSDPFRFDVWITDHLKVEMATTSRMLADLLPRAVAEHHADTPPYQIPENFCAAVADFVQSNFHLDPICENDVDYDPETIYQMFSAFLVAYQTEIRPDRVIVW